MSKPVLTLEAVTVEVPGRRLLADVYLEMGKGESLAVTGPSGSGKTSLLNCIAGITLPARGDIRLLGRTMNAMGPSARAAMRLELVGYVFQFGELLPELNVVENVALPLKLRGLNWRDAESRARSKLSAVGLAGFESSATDVLSGGEVQRVAVARALVGDPALVLADEPTGALDEDNAAIIAELLFELAAGCGAAVIVGTHNPAIAARATRTTVVASGALVGTELAGAFD